MRKSLLFLLGAALLTPQINAAVENKAFNPAAAISAGRCSLENFTVPFQATGLNFVKDDYNQISVPADTSYTVGLWFNATGVGGVYSRNHLFAVAPDKTECSTWTHWMVSSDANGNYFFNVKQNDGGLQEDPAFENDEQAFKNGNDYASMEYCMGRQLTLGTHTMGEWHHMLVCVDNANGKLSIFVDGELDKEATLTKPLIFNQSNLFQFGFQGSNNNKIDEVQFFNHALNAEEALKAYANAAEVKGCTSIYTFSEVAAGTTSTFTNQLIGGVDVTGAVYKKSYSAYWGIPYNYYNYTGKEEIAPTLVEGRDMTGKTVELTLSEISNGGSLTVTPVGESAAVNVGANNVEIGSVYTVTATPADGYALVGVYAETANGQAVLVNGTDVCVLGTTKLSARFSNSFNTIAFKAENPVPFVVYHNGIQVATSDDASFDAIAGETYKMVFTVPFDLVLNGITVDGQEIAAVDNACEFTVGDNTNQVIINAVPKETFTVTINQPMVDGVAAGTITVTGSKGEIENGGKAIVGDELTVSFAPAEGYRFRHYIINGELTAANTIVVEDAVSFGVDAEAGNEYPALTHSFANGAGQQNRLIKAMKQVGKEGYLFNAETQAELGFVPYSGGNQAEGAVINKTGIRAGHFEIDGATRQFSCQFTPYTGTINTPDGVKNSEIKWTNFLIYVDWNNDGDFADEGESCYWDNDQAGTDTHYTTDEGCTGIINVPEGLAEGTYRMRFILYEPNAWPYTEESRQQAFVEYVTATNIRNGVAYDFDIDVASSRYEAARKVTFASNFDAAGTVKVGTEGTEQYAPLPDDAVIEGSSVTTDYKYVAGVAEAIEPAAFMYWTNKDGVVLSSDTEYVYTGTEAATLTANFGYTVTTEAEGEGRLAISSNGENYTSGSYIPAGNKVTITPVADEGYELTSLSLNDQVVELASDGTYTFTLEGAASLKAVFGVHTYTVTYAATGQGSLTVGLDYDSATGAVLDAIQSGTELTDEVLFYCVADPQPNQTVQVIKYADRDGEHLLYHINGGGTATVESSYNDDADAWYIGTKKIGFVVYGVLSDYVIEVDFSGDGTAIDGIELDAANGAVEYFNLQGVKVAAENLTPGFYIARQGNKAVKVLINK